MTEYAVTRALNAGTGDTLMSGSNWKAGVPATEVVLRILRTQRGSYAPDVTFGRDFSIIDKLGPQTPALWQAETQRALAAIVQNGLIAELVVEVQSTGKSTLLESISFIDPRSANPQRQSVRNLVP